MIESDDQLNRELAQIAVELESQRALWQQEGNERPLPSLLLSVSGSSVSGGSVSGSGSRDSGTQQGMKPWSVFIEAGCQPQEGATGISADSGAIVSVSFQSRAILDAVRAGSSTLQSAFLSGDITIAGAHEECWFVSQVMSSVWSE
ncbi:MAG: hypothetical protein ACO3XO_05635 [Bdellovibrionota bacterium]